MNKKLTESFFQQDVLTIAPELLGCNLVRCFENGEIFRFRITEVEAYRGEEDKACHAHRGRTNRTELLYHSGGKIYVYLIYGIYWLLNIVTGTLNHPQGVMIRSVENCVGPGRVGRKLLLDGSFKGESIEGERLWIEYSDPQYNFRTAPRIGIDYAKEWKEMPWRFILER